MTGQAADVIVIGGGLMGAATAFFLRRRGVSVILLERGLVGQQASGVNFGNVRRQGRFLPQLPLANRAREIWGRLPELIGEDVEFLPLGHIRVCFDEEAAAVLEQHARDVRDYGLDLEIISRNALRHRFPWLGPDVVAGSLSPDDGHANPRLAAPAFARAAARLGAVIRENTEVTGIARSGEDFVVETAAAGRFRAPAVQVSTGAWAGPMAAALGERVPFAVHGPLMAVTEPLPYSIEPSVGVYSRDRSDAIYLRQVTRGNVVYGGGWRGHADADARRAHADPVNTLRQLPKLARIVPALSRARIIRTWSGIEGYLADDIPVIGPSAAVPGLYYAFGFCGHGFQLGPGVGDVMAELIATGATATPIEPFHIRRFETR